MIAQAEPQPVQVATSELPPQTERWPIPQAAMFIFTSASLCWIAIFAVIRALFV
ncbi:MAG: hypothetical protein H6851_01010 [Geminicoccaceae bacterium]|nr:hypothetical protein [Geminicoccaceae bacterium]MCB9942188.1 hypothetical protein [Geminicoccaceae bacterium]